MKIFLNICVLLFIGTINVVAQPTSNIHDSKVILSAEIDSIILSMHKNEWCQADAHISQAVNLTISDQTGQDWIFFRNYFAEKIFANINLFQSYLVEYYNNGSTLLNRDKLYALYLTFHGWLFYYLTTYNINFTELLSINEVWKNIFAQIYNARQAPTTSLPLTKEQSMIVLDGILPSVYLNNFLIKYVEYGSVKFEQLLEEFTLQLGQQQCRDLSAYYITIADRLSILDNPSLLWARSIYAAIAQKSTIWREYAISQVCAISCRFGDIEHIIPIYIDRLFSEYRYEDSNNYYIDVISISPYLEPSLVIKIATRAYVHLTTSDILDKNYKLCGLLTLIGKSYYKLNEIEKSEDYLEKALSYIDPNSKTSPLNTIELLMLIAIEKNEDLMYIEKILKTVADERCLYDRHNVHYTFYRLYLLNLKLHRFEEAKKYLHRSLVLVKNELQQALLWMPSNERSTYWTLLANWDLFTATHIHHPDIKYDIVLLKKGLLLNIEKSIQELVSTSHNSHLINAYHELMQSQKRADTDEVIATEREFLRQLRRSLGVSIYNMDLTYIDISKKLGKNTVAVEYATCKKIDSASISYTALVLRKGWDAPKYVELCTLEELQTYYLKGDKAYNDTNSAELYNLIWSKLEPYINEGDHVYFAPDGLLYQMNIEVLQDADGKRANEKWNLHRVSSTRELCIEKPKTDLNSAVLYGGLIYEVEDETMLAQSRTYRHEEGAKATRGFIPDSTMRAGWIDLENTKKEVDSIARMCRARNIKTEVYTAMAGNEESFKALSGKKTPIIHLATHGFFYKNEEVEQKPFFKLWNLDQQPHKPDNSLKRSGLILAGGQKAWLGEPIPSEVEDGVLLAEEIATMDLSGTDLVVLSACETGLGEITSEGVFGLQRAFKKAGVQTLLMSLWRVDDQATSLFMQTFYKHWLDGKTKHEAFTEAQRTIKESSDYSNPYYWAGFILLD